jgi:methylated-DNA-[protein]-cysteine S-methyltransferase
MKYYVTYDSPAGRLWVAEEGGAITDLRFSPVTGAVLQSTPLLEDALGQLTAYFDGKLQDFQLPVKPAGTPFQQACWRALQAIPYGETRAYADIAAAVGNPKACRAVGLANNRNPVAIIIPCHRVIGRDGSLTGYAGGLHFKRHLLELEKRNR